MTSLFADLESYKKEFLAKAPIDKVSIMQRADLELAESDIISNVLSVGDRVENFTLADVTGKKIDLYSTLEQGPVVLVFYRGGWCPYCNLELRAYQRLLDQFREKGVHIIAISPQTVEASQSTQEKNTLSYPVLSDPELKVSDQFGLVHRLPKYLGELYKEFGIEAGNHYVDDSWRLPLPATFIVSQKGLVLERFVETDYKLRMEPKDVLYRIKILDENRAEHV